MRWESTTSGGGEGGEGGGGGDGDGCGDSGGEGGEGGGGEGAEGGGGEGGRTGGEMATSAATRQMCTPLLIGLSDACPKLANFEDGVLNGP